MEKGHSSSFNEGILIEMFIVNTGFIEIVRVIGLFSGILFIKESIEDYGKTGVEDIVELVDEVVEEDYS